MKNVASFKKIILTTLFTVLPLFAHAGGGSPGGGNPIQNLVRDTINALLENAKTMMANPAQKAVLVAAGFDPFYVSRIINTPPKFEPLCASGAVLKDIQSKGKTAYVYDANPRVINLDCTDDLSGDGSVKKSGLEKWQELANSPEDWAAESFIHEALRVAGKITEDNDNMSSAYSEALRLDPNYLEIVKSEVMTNLIGDRDKVDSYKTGKEYTPTSGGPNCYIAQRSGAAPQYNFYGGVYMIVISFTGYKSGRFITGDELVVDMGFGHSDSTFINSALIAPYRVNEQPEIMNFRDRVYLKYKSMHCHE